MDVPVVARSPPKPAFHHLLFLLILLFAASAQQVSALAFSEYAFLLPQDVRVVGIGPCSPFLAPVFLTRLASQRPGFEEGVGHARDAVKLMGSARQLAQFQQSPLFWGGANAVAYGLASIACHNLASEAIREAVLGVNANWPALDEAIFRLEFYGVEEEGPAQGVYRQLEESALQITNRTTSQSLGGAFVKALGLCSRAGSNDYAARDAVDALAGQSGVLERQLLALQAVEGVLEKTGREFVNAGDGADQRLQECRRLRDRLEADRIFLIPDNAFALQSKVQYAQTGSVQSFPQMWSRAGEAILDSAESRKKAQATWNARDARFAERSLGYVRQAREYAEEACGLLESLDRQSSLLEASLLSRLESERGGIGRLQARVDSATWLAASNAAMEKSGAPLPRERGSRIIRMAEAVQELVSLQQSAGRAPDSAMLEGSLSELLALVGRAERDGLAVGEEKSEAIALEAALPLLNESDFLGKTGALRASVLAKACAKYCALEQTWRELLLFERFLNLPGGLFDGTGALLVERNLGSLAQAGISLESLLSKAQREKGKWLKERLEQSVLVEADGLPVQLDSPASLAFRLSYKNPLGFGSENPVLLERPKALPSGGCAARGDGIRVLEDSILLERVEPASGYSAGLSCEKPLARTVSFSESTAYSRPSVLRRAVRWVFSSDAEGTVLFEKSFPYAIHNAFGNAELSVANGTVRGVFLGAHKGQNEIRFEYDVLDPVRVEKTASADKWSYLLQNKMPFVLELPLRFEEAAPCALSSGDFHVSQMQGGFWRIGANVTLNAFEQRSLSANLGCAADALANQSAALGLLFGGGAAAQQILKKANDALSRGSPSEAAFLLYQLQNPSAQEDPLEKARALKGISAEAEGLFSTAEAALSRGDIVSAKEALDALDGYAAAKKKAVEERIKSACSSCPQGVAKLLGQAKSALFLGKIAEADSLAAQAEQLFSSIQTEEEARKKRVQAALDELDSADFGALKAFDTAFGVPPEAVRWRGVLQAYKDAKARYDSLASALKKLDDFRLKEAKGVDVSPEEAELLLNRSLAERDALAEELGAFAGESRLSVEAAEKAFQQFGSPALSARLEEARSALAEGRHATAKYYAENLSFSLQRAPSQATGQVARNQNTEIAAGLGALVVLGGLLYFFKFRRKPEALEEL